MMSQSQCFKGTHGTTVSAAKRINKDGFVSGPGLRGTGVYFWIFRNLELSEYARKLAESWWAREYNAGSYADHKCKDFAVITANLDNFKDSTLDFEPLRESFMVFQMKVKSRFDLQPGMSAAKKKEILTGLYDLFVSQIEKKSKTEFSAIISRVPKPKVPKGFVSSFDMDFDVDVVGQPQCILIRNKFVHDINIENG